MFMSFEESVIAAADDDGTLTVADTERLLKMHGRSLAYLQQEDNGLERSKLDARDAETLLAWLGY